MDKKKGFIGEFKEFISRGNVVDMAVGVVVGGAFTAIVNSLVNDVIMPIVGAIVGGINFANLKIVIRPAEGDLAEAAICYGNFIQAIVNVAFVLFCVVKGMNKLKKKEEAPAPEPPKPSEEVLLLREIRDALKENK